jgi:GNAT superfamily N-acetyltransferase
MEVRPARVEDAGQIAEIHVRSWQGVYRGLMPQDYLDSLDPARRAATWADRITDGDWTRGGCLVVAGDDGELAGFASVGRTRDPGPGTEAVGEVMAIYLAPQAWGLGLGRELMAASLRNLSGCGYCQVMLWVLESNTRARRFYAAAGFGPDGATKTDESLGFPIHEVRYRRPLP